MDNVQTTIPVCGCDDAKCVNKSVHTDNLGVDIKNLQPFNAEDNRKNFNETGEKSDREVYDLDAAGISIVPATPSNLPIGGQLKLTAEPTVFTMNPPMIVWESADISIAHVDSEGIVYAHKVGTVVITATNSENTAMTAQVNITVVDPNAVSA